MAQTGYTPIALYNSATASNVPSASNLVAGELAINTADGKLFYKDSSNNVKVIAANVAAIANGGTGATTATTAFNALAPSQTSNSGKFLTTDGTNTSWAVGGSVTSVAVSGGTTGLTTSGGPITSSGTITLAGTLAIANGGTGATTLAGANIPVTNAANTFTNVQTFSGSTSLLSAAFTNATEVVTVSATAATGTVNYDVTTQSVLYYTTDASANWTVNFRASSGTSLNTAMATGQSITVVFLVSQGATAYYNNAVTIDGTSVTPKYQGGTAWTSGNASGVDAYSYTIIKTGSAAYSVFVSQTQFK